MKNLITFDGFVNENAGTGMTAEQLRDELEAKIRATFPDSFVNVKIGTGLSGGTISIGFLLGKDKTEWQNQIQHNDPARHSIMIFLGDKNTDIVPNNADVQLAQGGSISVKPPQGSYLAYGRVKTGWRNFKGDGPTIVRKIDAYFKKLKEVIKDNVDNMVPRDAELAKKKI